MFNNHAFSLIELLVIMTVLACLATMAATNYNQYIVRARVAHILSVAVTQKTVVMDNTLPLNRKQAVSDNVDYTLIDEVLITTLGTDPIKHVVHVTAKMKTDSHFGIGLAKPPSTSNPLFLQLHGIVHGNVILWSCHVNAEYHDYVTSDCRNSDLEVMSVG